MYRLYSVAMYSYILMRHNKCSPWRIMLEITVSLIALRIKEPFNNLAHLDSFLFLPEIEEFMGNLGMVFAMLGRKLLSFETRGCASGSRHFFRYFLHQSVAATLSEFLAIIFTRCSFTLPIPFSRSLRHLLR